MSTHLVAIGGSGQDVALCYLRLAVLCGFTPASVWILDADLEGDVSKSFKDLVGLHSNWSHEYLDPYPTSVNKVGATLVDVLAATAPRSAEALGVLFTDPQQRLPVKKGMWGRPAVGAATIAAKLAEVERSGNQDTKFAMFVEQLRLVGDQRVMLTGSAFGGTGSGGVPALARYLRSQERSGGTTIGALVLTPWFHLLPPVDVAKRSQFDPDQDIIERNGSGWVAFFRDDLRKHMNRLILAGLRREKPATRPFAGSVKQPEHKHFFTLFCAHLLHQDLVTAQIGPAVGEIKSYYCNPAAPIDIAALPVRRSSGTVALGQCVKEMNAMMEFLRAFVKYLDPLPKIGALFPLFPSVEVPAWLRRTLTALGHGDPQEGARLLVQEVGKEIDALETVRSWFVSLKGDDVFDFTGDRDFTSSKYDSDRHMPLGFIKAWMANTDTAKEVANAPAAPGLLLPTLREKLRDSLRDTVVKMYVRHGKT
jgi:hypothetical protein